MKNYILLLIFGLTLVLMACSCKNYKAEAKTIYEENGIKFSIKVTQQIDFLYPIRAQLFFIAENYSSSILYLTKVIIKIDKEEKNYTTGDYYVNDKPVSGDYPIGAPISNNCSLEGRKPYLPDADTFNTGDVPCSAYVKFKVDEIEKEINKDFTITVVGWW